VASICSVSKSFSNDVALFWDIALLDHVALLDNVALLDHVALLDAKPLDSFLGLSRSDSLVRVCRSYLYVSCS
jgi:hypothetical protein